MIGIYKITNPKGKIYIGQSINIKRRFKDYKNSLKKSQRKIYNSFKKYGYDNHTFEIIEKCLESELNDRERYYQGFFNCIDEGLNCRYTKTNDKSGHLSKETILKLKNKDFSYMVGNDFRTGFKHSEEIKNKIRNTLIENSKKPDYVNAMTGKCGELNPFYGKKHTEETKKILAEKSFANKKTLEKLIARNKARSCKLLDTKTGVNYESIKQASEELNINFSSLKAMLSGKYKNKTNLIKL